MSNIKSVASPMPGCPDWTIAVFKAVDVPEGTEVSPVQPVAVPDIFEQVRFRFFKDLNTEERKKVFKAFGVWPGDGEGKNIPHVWETLLLRSIFSIAAPAAQGDAKDEVYEFAAKVIELFDDATMRANHMLDAGECATVIRALKSTEIAAIAAKGK